MMDSPELRAWMLGNFTDHPRPRGRTMFRLETLDAYEVASDGNDFGRYIAGEPTYDRARKMPWLDTLRAERTAGLRRSRVHVLETPLTPYLRYECEWGYAPNEEAGERIGILNLSEVSLAAAERDLFVEVGDFWLLNEGEQAVRMHYDNRSQFVGAEIVDDPALYVEAANVAHRHAAAFSTWWARHPEEHRANRQVA